jgi:hypothetical protein
MNEFTKIVEKEAKHFISNVLCIDDEVVYDSQDVEPEVVELVEPGRENLVPGEDDSVPGTSVGRRQLRADLMIAAFAREGILCTPLNPQHIDKSDLDAVLAKADVIILDWEIILPGLPADKPASDYCLQIIEELKKQDRFRLVIIYTGAGDEDIASEIDKICPKKTKTNIVWEIWGKPNSLRKGDKVDYEKLPLEIIKKFAGENSGILPAAVLRSLTGIRENSFRLLNTFTKDLDKALLYHRMLIPNSDDAEKFCRDIIADEFLGILNDLDPGQYINDEYAVKYIDEKKPEFLISKNPKTSYSQDKIKHFLSAEIDKKDVNKIISGSKLYDEDMLKRFSVISTTRTLKNSFLQLGCVLKRQAESSEYYLCLQPPCDSVRIEEQTGFIFCGLQDNPKSNISFYINYENENIAFKIDYRSRYVFVFEGNNKISLTDVLVSKNKKEFTCIGQLKPMFAQKIANEFASGISRVGIDQFEWLRKQG